jgi:transposase-like protein
MVASPKEPCYAWPSADAERQRREKGFYMEMVTVATFNEPEQAEPLRKRLQETGVPARIHDERRLQKWFMSETLAGIRVQVERHHYAEAKKLLAEWDVGHGALREAIHCPECKSSQIEYPQFTRKFIFPSIGLFLSTLGFVQKKFYCQECHYTWPLKQKVQAETDLLGWPKK